MDNEEIEQKLSTIEKKLDKLLTLNTKIAKALHLIPVSEKEERDIQIKQRESFKIQAKVNSELNAMENKPDENEGMLSIDTILTTVDAYSDILGEDYLGG